MQKNISRPNISSDSFECQLIRSEILLSQFNKSGTYCIQRYCIDMIEYISLCFIKTNFLINFEHTSHIVLMFPLLTLNKNIPAGTAKQYHLFLYFKPAITCSKLTIETLEQSVKYVQS